MSFSEIVEFLFLPGYHVAQVVGLVHADLHDDQTLNAVNFLASTLLWITQDNEPKDAGKISLVEFYLCFIIIIFYKKC